MSLGAGIFDYLSTSLSVGERVYPLTLPQGVTLPAVSYQVVSETPIDSHSTAQDNPTYTEMPLERTRVQFNCYGSDFDEAEALYEELVLTLRGARGVWGSINVQAVFPDIALDDYDPDSHLWRRIVDVFIHYQGGGIGS